MRRNNEHIVGLTFTEIMLVLVVVILLLLLAKDFELKRAIGEAGQSESAVESGALAERKQILEDLGREVTEKLVDEGFITREEKSEQQFLEDAQATVIVLIEERRNEEKKREEGLPMEDLGREVTEKLVDGGFISREDKSERQFTEEAQATVVSLIEEKRSEAKRQEESLPMENLGREMTEKLIEDGLIRREEKSNQQLSDEVSTVIGEMLDSGKKQDKRQLKDKIGFLPCWPGDGSPWYYYSFNITFRPQKNLYKIEPHRHLKSNVAVVKEAIGRLPRLKEYPQDWVSSDILRRFGKNLNKQKRALYGEECYLVTTINKKGVDGTVAEFLRDEVHLYPIWRKK